VTAGIPSLAHWFIDKASSNTTHGNNELETRIRMIARYTKIAVGLVTTFRSHSPCSRTKHVLTASMPSRGRLGPCLSASAARTGIAKKDRFEKPSAKPIWTSVRPRSSRKMAVKRDPPVAIHAKTAK
jgi:hypothetical protein